MREKDTAADLAAKKRALLARLLRERGIGSRPGEVIVRRPAGVEPALSFAQQRLWFLDQMDAGSAYTSSWAGRLAGPLDARALESSLDEVVRRHEALRTVFPAVDGRPSQRVQTELRIPLARVDLRGRAEVDRAKAASEWAIEEAQHRFDLALGPLLRASLLELGEDDHALVLTLHHIVTDGWSMEVLVGELAVLYEAFTRGAPSPLPELPVQYADFAHWQRSWLQGEVLEEQLSYWRRRLAGRLPVLELPTDRPRPPVRTYRGGTHTLVFPRAFAGNVHALGQREGVTLFMTLAAALQVLLQRYTGQDDLLIGFSVANRNRAELEGLIGFFVNNLVLRTDLSGDPSFRELLARVKEGALEAYDHQDLPFEKLVEELHPDRDLAQNPIFQVMLDVQNAARKELRLSGLTLTPIEIDARAARFDLDIHFFQGGEDVGAVFHYDTDLFDATTIARMATHYQTLLQGAAEDPERRVSELPILTAAERDQVLVEWNATARQYPREATLAALFEAQVERTPEAVAVSFEESRLTYGELNRQANRLAHHLVSLGVGPEVPVGICVERSLEMVVGLLGILKAGGAYVPIDPTYPEDRLAFMLADADVPVLLTQEHLSAGLPAHRARVIHLDRIDESIARASDANPAIPVDPRNLAYVIYTSGSTGRPKGAMNSHAGICNRLFWMQEAYGLGASDRVLQKTPFSFDVSVWEFFWPLMAGARLVVAKPAGHQDPAYLAGLVRDEEITTVHFVPSMLAVFLEDAAVAHLKSLRRVICSGEALSYDLQQRFFARIDAPLFNLYGPTEAAVDVTQWACRRGDPRPVVPIGAPIANTRTYVLDQWMRPVPAGVPGELFLGGVQVGRGYHHRPDLTAERFVPDPFSAEPGQRLYRTGDLVRYLADGQIDFLGRMDHQVKIRGFRIELGEIESVLAQDAGVRDVVVVARKDDRGDTRLVAYVVGLGGAEMSVAQLRRHAQERLPPYMVPASFVVLDEMPLGPSGKVDRRALPDPEGVGIERERPFVAPRTAVEREVAGIWKEILRADDVGVHDSFFELGGHSLLVTQLVSRLLKTFGVEVPLRAVFQAPTVAELAARVEASRRERSRPPLVRLAEGAERTQSFAQQRLWFIDQLQPGSSAYNISTAVFLDGELDAQALRRSLQSMVDRHEALRTTFATVDGRPLQVVAPSLAVALAEIDLRRVPDPEQQARRLAEEDASRPFDLVHGPLLRASLLRLADQAHALIVTVHHIVSDEWSMGLLAREQALLYAAHASGSPSPLPELAVQYADFAAWQRDWLRDEVLEDQLAYWRERLAELEPLGLPIDHPRPPVETFNGGWRRRSLPVLEQVKRLGQREGTTLFITLLAAFQALLARHTGSDDIVVGSPVANRPRVELEGVIGLFVNSLVLRTDLSGDPTFRELLARVKEVALGAYDHQDLPFERLVEEVAGRRDLSRNPLFQVIFTLHGAPVEPVGLPGLRARLLENATTSSHVDLEMHLYQGADALIATAVYNRDLFEAATIDRMLGHFQVLLEAVVARPDSWLSELPLLTAPERQRVLVDWNDTRREYPRDGGIAERFGAQAATTPEAIALAFNGEELSYRELDARANRLARHLRTLGVRPEVKVGICMDRSMDLVVGLLGILKAGGAYVPLDASYPTERLAFMLEDSGVPVLLTQERMLALLPEHRARVVCLDRDRDAFARWSDAPLESGATPENLAYVTYTSGSTGVPKGVEVRQRGVLRLVFGSHYAEFGPDQTFLQLAPVSFDASTLEIWGALLHGGKCVVYPDRVPTATELGEVIEAEGVTTLWLTASLYNAMVDESPAALAGVKQLLIGGEALSVSHVRRGLLSLPRTRIINGYGPTESTTFTCCHPIPRDLPEDVMSIPIGRPIGNTRVYILDGGMRPVPAGVAGELYIGGDGLARGYLNRPELTAEKFVPDPFDETGGGRLYRTGDLGRYLADGTIEFRGRVDHQVKVRGYRIELGEIESVLRQDPAVKDALVVVREDAPAEKRLVAYVVRAEGVNADAGELRGFLKDRLPEYMVPPALVFLDTLPLTPNGKVDRRALPLPEAGSGAETYEGPRTRVEEVLARIWSEVLRVEVVGVRDNFFELGGDSILSLQVMARANDAGLRLSLKQLFQHQTVAELARVAGTVAAVEAEQGAVTGPVPLTPVQRWFFERELESPHHFNQAVLLEVRREVAPEVVESALRALESHHDALRMRFDKGPSGWEQRCEGPGADAPFRRADLRGLDAIEQKHSIEREVDEAQRSLHLARGPLWRVILFDVGEGQPARLLIVVHHLVVDGVSWRLLLEDLQTACGQLSRAERVRLPRKTTSFQRWSERLREYAASGGADGELEYWRAVAAAPKAGLPVDHPGGDERNTVGTSRTVSVVLGEAETRALLQEVPAAYRTQIGDVLLTALVEAFAPWTGREDLLVELEGHGREELFEGADLSRTVGWFTTIYPVRLSRVAGDPGQVLGGVKEQLRRVPNRGIGYGLLRYLSGQDLRSGADVAFNYLGQFDQLAGEDGLFVPAAESAGRAQSERARRTHLLEVNGLVAGSRLRLDWVYSEAVHERETVEALARRFEDSLRGLIAHCRSGAWGFTPSDFPLAKLDAAHLDGVVGGRRDVEDIYPLSPMQEGMLLHTLMAPDSGVYLEQTTFELEGVLDAPALRRSWERVVERHGALRTRFSWEGQARPLQVVERGVTLPWDEEDWRGRHADEQAERFEELSREDQERGFDLDHAPLLRIRLIRLQEERYRLVWSFHHALLDGWCLPLLMKEVLALYQSYTRGMAAELADVRPYREYIAWLQGQDEAAAERYWRDALSGFTIPTPLVVDRPSRGNVAAEAGERVFLLGEEATRALKSLGRRHGLTLNTVVQGAWAVLLSRYSGQQDVVFGVTASGRPASLPGVETMVGLFINTLPLRAKVEPDQAVVEWLKGLQASQVEQRQWEHSPLAQVQKWSPVPAGQALFESLLVFENYPVDPALWAVGLEPRVTSIRFKEKTNYPLSLVAAGGPRLFLRFVYEQDRFDEEAIARLEGHLAQILEAIAAEPARRLSELRILTAAERRQAVVDWNQTDAEYPREAGIHELFERQAAKTPDVVALSFGAAQLTYGELNARANRLAHHLRRHGVGLETRVGICTERSAEMVVGLLGILKAGGVYVPLDPSYPKDRLAFMIEDSRVPVLVSQERMLATLPEHGARMVCLDRDGDEVSAESDANPGSGAGGDSLAYVIYTSGSTGIPKGVAIPHRAVNRLVIHTDYVQLEPGDRVAQASNASFDAATFEIWGALLTGARLIGISREVTLSPRDLAEELRRSEVTTLFLTTALFNQVAREEPQAFSSLKHLLFGGEAVDPDRVRSLRRGGNVGRLLHVYGPTETTTFATWHLVNDVAEGATTVPIGRPIANTRMYVLDGRLDPVAVGIPGELYLGGDGLARGYLGHPELTAEKFVPDPFSVAGGERLYRTGDLVRQRADGAIEFLGRVDHQVKLRGFRIELGEIESMLARHEGVQDAVVVLREDEAGDKRLVAYVVAAEGTASETAELRDLLARNLPEYMVPSAFVFLEALPLNANGKVDRGGLPAPEARAHSGHALVPPRNDLEREIAAIWREVLHLDEVGVDDNFFDLGGHSLSLLRVHGHLRARLPHAEVKIVDLFEYPTIAALAAHLSAQATERDEPREVEPARVHRGTSTDTDAIAIIGMAGRFPGARDVEEFWRNLRDSVESITFFSNEELEAEGIPPALCRDPRFVKARGVLEGGDRFDAAFFGYSAREAEMIDPQQRVFLETAWTALETAGYDAERHPGRIAVYAGTSLNTYMLNLAASPELLGEGGGFPALIASDKDFLTTRVSYKLDLRGPSVDVQTACSTSLVAVHLACQSLRMHECDMALAGGVSMGTQKGGHFYQEGGILSPDGHCRAFDRKAQGTVSGSGVGVVVLKRLRDALADGDLIDAVIKGSAINNDGAVKVGYTAPGVEGQAEVIRMAQAAAGVEPETIGYIEAHGTGTALGDPIEIRALRQVFGDAEGRTGSCAIGSLKTNIGHLDAAAGVAGLIKAVLALHHGQIPASLHFEEANPGIDFADTPFRVNAGLAEWARNGAPRRAGVSSFGIGGTNAHVVLEEAPTADSGERPHRPFQLLVLSAKTPAALDEASSNLALHLEAHPELDLADTAYTLQTGRRAFRHRRAVVCRDLADARRALVPQEAPARGAHVERTGRGVTFLFPGQGSQRTNMLLGLYRTEESFRKEIDAGAEILRPELGLDLREVLYPSSAQEDAARDRLDQTATAQPALFLVEHALARLWMAWGVKPEAMLGHSVGEYVAACLAGVLSLEDALSLLAFRGRLMQAMPSGSMLMVALPETEIAPLLEAPLSLAAVNGPAQCVVSGPHDLVEGLEQRLGAGGTQCQRLRTSHAFHSAMMEPMLAAFRERLSRTTLREPRIPYVSNLTGTWITAGQAVDADYWVRHLRETVRFGAGVSELLKGGPRVLLEVGPGQTLSGLVRAQADSGGGHVSVASARHPGDSRPDEEVLLGALGRLWMAGVDVDWRGLHTGERRRRVRLPTYPFERQRYWLEPAPTRPEGSRPLAAAGKKADIAEWFYRPTWHPSEPSLVLVGETGPEDSSWLVFSDECGLGPRMARRLAEDGRRVVSVTAGERFERKAGDAYAMRPAEAADYEALLRDLKADGFVPDRIAHLWGVSGAGDPGPSVERSQELGFHSLVFLAQALGTHNVSKEVGVTIVTSGMQEVSGEGLAHRGKATVLGPCRVIPQEYANLSCRSLDVMDPDGPPSDEQIDRLLAECNDRQGDPVVAYRRDERWVQGFEPLRLERRPGDRSRLRQRGVYLITGGMGGIGLELARFLAETVQARIVLVGRTPLPPREEWAAWRESRGAADRMSRRISQVEALEARGAEVLLLSADVANRGQMEDALSAAEARFGHVDGVIHAAGVAPGGVIQLKTREMAERVLAAKVTGTLVLEALLKDREPDFLVLCSSLASTLGVPGQVDYCAANAFQDAFARGRAAAGGAFVLSLNWDTWIEAGMAVESDMSRDLRDAPTEARAAAEGILSREGSEVFARALGRSRPHILVSTVELGPRIERFRAVSGTLANPVRDGVARHPRPEMATPYVAPRNSTEEAIAQVWQELLGFERVGIQDNFFDLGGHSLLLVQVHRRLQDLFPERELSVVELFTYSTVAALAAHLSGPPAASASVALEELEEEAERREAGRDRLGRRRGIHTALAEPGGPDA
jgi:amino acid adenylation domain-containing protein/non-ribosomal peptide synthase protein (TIGR01720 family)